MSDLARQVWHAAKRFPGLRALARHPLVEGIATFLHRRLVLQSVEYQRWMKSRLAARRTLYRAPRNEPGLLSFLTTVWNTPVDYVRALADSLLGQAVDQDFEWVVLDNGSSDRATIECLADLAGRHKQIRYLRMEQNLGIVGGMRLCLEHATGRYVLPLDSDDLLYPDCLRIMAWHIQQNGYPPLLYSDEDKLQGGQFLGPFFKPEWDPVLFANSCYIAHLCAIDRQTCLELGIYSDRGAEGCHDWDTFFRFWLAGHNPVHVPEVLYSWRMHESSCALNVESKSFIHQSHRAVLTRYLAASTCDDRFELLLNPLLQGRPDWWIRRKHTAPRPLLSVVMSDTGATDGQTVVCSSDYPDHRVSVVKYDEGVAGLKALVAQAADEHGLVCLVSERMRIENSEWPWEALGLMERYPDTSVVGGVIRNRDRAITEAGREFGFGGGLGCPHRGQREGEPGYAAAIWRQRSVSAVSSQFCVFDAAFLLDLLENGCPADARLEMLGAWAGAYACRTGRRVVYSPFMQSSSDDDWQSRIPAAEETRFLQANADLLPDHRYYPVLLSLDAGQPFRRVDDAERRTQEQQLVRRATRAA